ncbi:hypothetical protein N474_07665 [Pseudoalteromonas luteoviolacea CPMOR-2]|uniref:SGNH/GDSL hydrolase family protein n=1 Tax=Pseudoalteromonas luteoviolacea DSM 6061 TaxID=1365250 RepID=A0A161ZYW3_9GAMM|nr:hypothetical protein [Pseudoalteromonas luteoviolacea]KZN39579.1 hypothetical protein N475_14275 [Pseudoalteromonas luteoviolacea DSM 6061]KZN57848.1 hypothetical protein N474_07665 [Pseudoalteromonas luteoviolacea CPMOR-2]MBE0388369.1 hypothetical protein [Pseudoalteromonas luteoviolacea DSM 6061]
MIKQSISVTLAVLLVGCGGSNDDVNINDTPQKQVNLTTNKTIPDNQSAPIYSVALIGNSHAAGLAPYLKKTLQHYAAEKSVNVETLGFGFTDDLYKNATVRAKLNDGQWSHLIIQGQKYSQSGAVLYSTKETQQWIALAKELDITPILFPEHPQKGRSEEAAYVMGIHRQIASLQAACVAPVGGAWNAAMEQMQNVSFHTSDGNHAAPSGLLLSSLVFSEIITGEKVDTGPISIIPDTALSAQQQGVLSQIASQVLVEQPACE